ncbi:unnamed protein product [Cuscuta epithymum]|uniref:GH10 domain-containing protein n=1 Tax=Cuscuta epithymum TaxID=186058 RepID=A0AAV0FHD7_9ASTE|nr:unnamed protein product [Cuscuta epithymum]
MIEKVRKREGVITVSNQQGLKLQGANITVEQISSAFPFGTAISKAILSNVHYQEWFLRKKFGVTVFENELKWPSTEPFQGRTNYTISDQMLDFALKNNILCRGHNVLWQDPNFLPSWVRNLSASPELLKQAADDRIRSVVGHYRNKLIHWDVNNEMLHYAFYEESLRNPNASLEFYKLAQEIDPNVTLFFNDFKVVESCGSRSNVDAYVAKIAEFRRNGIRNLGMGLEGHFFNSPNPVYTRSVLDKFATLGVPIWITEADTSGKFGPEKQAVHLEMVLRELFSHPAVDGIVLWAAMSTAGSCWQMCLTDGDFKNTLAGDVVDKLLGEWHTGTVTGVTDSGGSFNFSGFLGTYKVRVEIPSKNSETVISLTKGGGPLTFQIHI